MVTHCRNCRRPIFNGKFSDVAWEPDYDPKDDSTIWRHENGYAGCTLSTFAEPRPNIVVLCGSTKFSEVWAEARYELTLDGFIVLTIGCDTKSDSGLGISRAQKKMLDELHKRKIDLADSVYVLNVGGYIGDSTRSEIDYATELGKPISYLEA